MDNLNIKTQIESVLFISTKPLSLEDIRKALQVEKEALSLIENALNELLAEYNQKNKGIHIVEIEQKSKKKYQMTTSPLCTEIVKRFTRQEVTGELTRPALETLTIVAYKGPITKPELEHIRGVNCSLILRNLMIRGLVEESTDNNTGDIYFSVTGELVKWLGLTSIKELPEYEELNEYKLSIESGVDEVTESM